jgi:hypothetical protein
MDSFFVILMELDCMMVEARSSGVFVLFYLITDFVRYNRTSIELVTSDSAWFVYLSSSVLVDCG